MTWTWQNIQTQFQNFKQTVETFRYHKESDRWLRVGSNVVQAQSFIVSGWLVHTASADTLYSTPVAVQFRETWVATAIFKLGIHTLFALPRWSDMESGNQDVILSWWGCNPPLPSPHEPCCYRLSTLLFHPLFVAAPDHEPFYDTTKVSLDMSTSNPATPVTAQTPSAAVPFDSEKVAHSESSDHSESKFVAPITDPAALAAREEADIEADKERKHRTYLRIRPFILCGLALLILGWWISATVLPATRDRWCVAPLR